MESEAGAKPEQIADDYRKAGTTEIQKRERIKELKEVLEEFNETENRKDGFIVSEGNISPFKQKIAKMKRDLKTRFMGIKKKTKITAYDTIHLSTRLNAVFFGVSFVDKYNAVYDFAEREFTKAFNPTKVIPMILPNGDRIQGLLFSDRHLSNIGLPEITFNEGHLEITAEQLEIDRVRLNVDVIGRKHIDMDDRQIKVLFLAIIFSLLGGTGLGFWLALSIKSMGYI